MMTPAHVVHSRTLSRTALLALFAFSASMFTGCANIKDDGQRTRTEGTLGGAALGAGAGAVLGLLTGNSKNVVAFAAAGAAAGAVAGYAYGDHVAGQKAKYARTEEWLEACIDDAERSNEEASAEIAAIDQDIYRLEAEEQSVYRQYRRSSDRVAALRKTKRALDARIAKTDQSIKRLKNDAAAQSEVIGEASGPQKAKLSREVEDLTASVHKLESARDRLAGMSARMSV